MSCGEKAEDVFRQCIKEHDVGDVDVDYEKDLDYDSLIISKDLGDNVFHYRLSLDSNSEQDKITLKQVAPKAREAASAIEQRITDSYKWDDGYYNVSVYDGGWAECVHCGERVQASPQHVSRAFTEDAELMTPHPVPKEPDNIVSSMSDYQKVLFRMYLIGRLRDNCQTQCPNSNHNQKV
jgi:hypothetical protein